MNDESKEHLQRKAERMFGYSLSTAKATVPLPSPPKADQQIQEGHCLLACMSEPSSPKRFKSEHGEPLATSTPIDINRPTTRHVIRREEYLIIETPDETLIDLESTDAETKSSSESSSGSLSEMLEMARQMIANYPNEEEIAKMISENYLEYIHELLQDPPADTPNDEEPPQS